MKQFPKSNSVEIPRSSSIQSNSRLKSALRHAIIKYFTEFKKGIAFGVGILFTLCVGSVFAVAVTGPFNFFTPGTLLKSSDINTNFASLKAAIEGIDSTAPAGTIVAYAGTSAPSGWLLCNGQSVSRNTYATLYAVIGNSFGSGDGSTTFHLPDFRGRFLRGLDGTANVDPDKLTRTAMNAGGSTGNAIGSVQVDAFQGHWHDLSLVLNSTTGGGGGDNTGTTGTIRTGAVRNAASDGTNGTPRTTSETRPLNAYLNWIIKQ